MKRIKSLLVAALLLGGASAAMAQATYTDAEGNEYQFKKHMFLDVQGGAQYTLGEAGFGDLISPNLQLGLGYQFNPWFAMRLQANGWQSKGGYNGWNELKQPAAINTNYKFNYVAPGLDFIFNLSNVFCGWNPNRVFNVSAFLGAGANIAWSNDEAVAMSDANHMRYIWDGTKIKAFGRGGIELNFRVSKAVSIMVEGNANVLNDRYNSKKAGNPDWYFNALAGLRINLGGSYTKKAPAPAPEPAPEPQEYVEPTPAPAPAPAPVVEKAEPLRRDVFFTINKFAVTKEEMQKVNDIVAYLNEHPDAKVTVTGYADAGTGNNRINDRIAKQRANSVVKVLLEKGISESRITSDSKGSRVQPFAENKKNRVSIMIAAE